MNPLGFIQIDICEHREEWVVDRVTDVRESCLTKHGNRLRLERLLIGDVALFGILMVSRINDDTYQIYKRKYTFEAALAMIESRMEDAQPKPGKVSKPRTRKPKAKKFRPPPVGQLALFQVSA